MRTPWPRRKKLRGGRRYFARLERWPETVRVSLTADNWYDLWHLHPDFHGWTWRGGRARRAHLRVLFAALDRVVTEVGPAEHPVQVFVHVSRDDPPSDAIYVHTPNPNTTPFPFRFEGCTFGEPPPAWFAPFVDSSRMEVGTAQSPDGPLYLIAPRGRLGRGATAP
jgi:hypothetical protein